MILYGVERFFIELSEGPSRTRRSLRGLMTGTQLISILLVVWRWELNLVAEEQPSAVSPQALSNRDREFRMETPTQVLLAFACWVLGAECRVLS